MGKPRRKKPKQITKQRTGRQPLVSFTEIPREIILNEILSRLEPLNDEDGNQLFEGTVRSMQLLHVLGKPYQDECLKKSLALQELLIVTDGPRPFRSMEKAPRRTCTYTDVQYRLQLYKPQIVVSAVAEGYTKYVYGPNGGLTDDTKEFQLRRADDLLYIYNKTRYTHTK